MKTLFATLACALAGLTLPGTALADGTIFGVADDTGKYADNPATFFDSMRDLGLTENRITALWDPANPTSIVETGFLARSLPVARAKGVDIVFAIYPLKPRLLGDSANMNTFLAFIELVARSYPQITQFQIGNEPNLNFFSPSSCDTAPETYVQLLAAAYDRLKAINPALTVISDLSPRGNDNCAAASNPSYSPVAFLNRMGKAYKALNRSKPLFDRFGFHPYPNLNTDPLDKGYQWPNAGFVNLDRIKQAVWDAFGGTGQPTFEEGMTMKLAEVGWQVAVQSSLAGLYTGRESVSTTDEATQAQIYGEIVRRAACDVAIHEVLFFGLIDEKDLDRFQAALLRADSSKRPAYDAVKQAIAGLRGRCGGAATLWKHATSVIGAAPLFKDLRPKPVRQQYWAFNATATEDANYRAGVFKLSGPRLSPSDSSAISRVLASAKAGPAQVLSTSGLIKAYFSPLVKFNAQTLKRGFYVYAIRMSAAMNPGRTSFFVSKPFRVGG